MNPFVGQWYKEEFGETLNIFDETPPRMKLSFASSGCYNAAPNCVYEKDGYLCWEINDDYYRMVYHVKPEGEALAGWYTQFGNDTPVRYERRALEPEDAPTYYRPTQIYVEESKDSRLDTLKKLARYDRAACPACEVSYALYGEVPEILREYGYDSVLAGQTIPDDALAFRLLDFVCAHFGHDGQNGSGGASIESIIRFCRKNDGKTNCRGLAMLLAALLRLSGIKASHITCLPYEQPFDDCHVVVDCLLPSGRRVMLDPTSHLYYRDKAGEPVSLPRLREMLIADEPLFPNEDASYNHLGFDPDGNREYMVKNTLRFCRGSVCADGVDGPPGKTYCLFPADYPADKIPRQELEEFIYNDEAFWAM